MSFNSHRWGPAFGRAVCLVGLAAALAVSGCATRRAAQGAKPARPAKVKAARAPAADGVATNAPAVPAATNAAPEDAGIYRLKVGDPLVLSLRGIPQEVQLEIVLDENGNIRPPMLQELKAVGKTSSELAQAVEKAYVEQQIYKRVTVTVIIPSQSAQSYYIQGEVRQPGRYPLMSSGVKLVQAIAAAGGYTEFASAGRVKIIRGDKSIRVNVKRLEKKPGEDKYLQSGDVIVVPRTWL